MSNNQILFCGEQTGSRRVRRLPGSTAGLLLSI